MDKWSKVKSGKVRDIWQSDNGRCIALVATDRVSAFDEKLGVIVPDKGKILTQMSAKWFELTENLVPNAILATDVENMPSSWRKDEFAGRTTEMIALRMLPLEAIVRGYITGSMWSKYCKGERTISDYTMPEGLQESQQLPEPIYTPTTKAPEGEHDMEVNFEQSILEIEKAGFENARDLAEKVRDYSLKLYSFCSDYAKSRGIILADSKFEFGVDEEGIVRVADEVCTPDSARFWSVDDYEIGRSQASMDKQMLRDWVKQAKEAGTYTTVPDEILQETGRRYRKCYELLFG